jgi:hypothetical protein
LTALLGRLHTSGSGGSDTTPRQTHASVEYLRRHAGLGQDSNPAKQCRIQLHVAVFAAQVKVVKNNAPTKLEARIPAPGSDDLLDDPPGTA